VKKLWNQKWQPRNGCDGRLMAKNLITTIQVWTCCLLHQLSLQIMCCTYTTGLSALSDIQARGPHKWYVPQADILLQVTNHQPILSLVNLCISPQKKELLHKLCSSWPGDAYIILWKFISQYAFCLALLNCLCSL